MKIRDDADPAQSLYADYLFWTKATHSTEVFNEYIRNANFALDSVLRKVYQVDGKWQHDDANNTTFPIDTTNLVAGQGDYGLPASIWRIHRVRVKNSDGKYITLKPLDRAQVNDDLESATGVPEAYDKLGSGILIYPAPNYSATAGVEVTYQRGSSYFLTTDTTKEPGIPPIFHRYISLYPARDYCATNEQGTQLAVVQNAIQALDQEVMELYSTRDRDGVEYMEIARRVAHY